MASTNAASQSACDSIQQSLNNSLDPEAALVEGIRQAQMAVAQLAAISKGEPPSTTIVRSESTRLNSSHVD